MAFGFCLVLAFGRFGFLAFLLLVAFGFWPFVFVLSFLFRCWVSFGLCLVCVCFCVPCVRFFVFGLVLFSCVCVYHLFDLIRFCFSECDRTTPLIAMRLLSLLVLLLLLPSPRTSCERDAQRIRDRNEEMRKQAKRSPVRVCGGPRVCVCVCVCACVCVCLAATTRTNTVIAFTLFIRPACYLRRAAIERMGIRSIRAPQPAPTRGKHSLIMAATDPEEMLPWCTNFFLFEAGA